MSASCLFAHRRAEFGNSGLRWRLNPPHGTNFPGRLYGKTWKGGCFNPVSMGEGRLTPWKKWLINKSISSEILITHNHTKISSSGCTADTTGTNLSWWQATKRSSPTRRTEMTWLGNRKIYKQNHSNNNGGMTHQLKGFCFILQLSFELFQQICALKYLLHRCEWVLHAI